MNEHNEWSGPRDLWGPPAARFLTIKSEFRHFLTNPTPRIRLTESHCSSITLMEPPIIDICFGDTYFKDI